MNRGERRWSELDHLSHLTESHWGELGWGLLDDGLLHIKRSLGSDTFGEDGGAREETWKDKVGR